MATPFVIAELNLPIESVRDANFPFARNLIKSNRFFSEPGIFGLANQTSLAIVARHTRPEEFTMLQKDIAQMKPELQVATVRLHALKRQVAQLDNLNFILQSKDLTEKIKLFKVMNHSLEEAIEKNPEGFNESYIRNNLPDTLNSSYTIVTDAVTPLDSKYLEHSSFDINDLSTIVTELTGLDSPPPPPAP